MTFAPMFLAHGSPMNAIQHNAFTQFLQNLGTQVQNSKPQAILMISAHWRSQGVRITGAANPQQIFDFGGFAEELYQVQYPVAGHPTWAAQLAQDLGNIQVDPQQGIDHGAWCILRWIYPLADVPILQLSLDAFATPQAQWELGVRLREYTDRLWILGSGNLVHNLRDLDWNTDGPVMDWAKKADQWFAEKIHQKDLPALFQYRTQNPELAYAHPTDEHLRPLFVVLGAMPPEHQPQSVFSLMQNGSISMRCIA